MAFHSRKLSTRFAHSKSRKFRPSTQLTFSAAKMSQPANTHCWCESHSKAVKLHSPTHRSIISSRRLFPSSSTVMERSYAKAEKRLRVIGGLLADHLRKTPRCTAVRYNSGT